MISLSVRRSRSRFLPRRHCSEVVHRDLSAARVRRFLRQGTMIRLLTVLSGRCNFWRIEISDGAQPLVATQAGLLPWCRTRSRSARADWTAQFSRSPEWIPLVGRGRALHPGTRGLGTDGVGPRAFVVSPGHHLAATRDFVLGHGRVAHGLERQRRGAERPNATARSLTDQGAAGILRAGEGFSRAWDQK